MDTIAIINLKGGVAKTTTTATLAKLLADGDAKKKRSPKRVLLFDNDKQGNLSKLFKAYDRDHEAAACKIIKTGQIYKEDIKSHNENLDIISCNYFMELAELEIKADKEKPQHNRYKKALEVIKTKYDYCIIDNPPDLGINVINALVAADKIIIPVQLDAYSLDGLEELREQIEHIKALNSKATLAGCLITDYEKTDTSEAAETWLRKKGGCPVFNTKIRHSKKAKDATIYNQIPNEYSPRCAAAQDYKKFVGEYITLYSKKEMKGDK